MPKIYLRRRDESRMAGLRHLDSRDVDEIENWLLNNCPKSKLNFKADSVYFHRRPDLNLFKILFSDKYRISDEYV